MKVLCLGFDDRYFFDPQGDLLPEFAGFNLIDSLADASDETESCILLRHPARIDGNARLEAEKAIAELALDWPAPVRAVVVFRGYQYAGLEPERAREINSDTRFGGRLHILSYPMPDPVTAQVREALALFSRTVELLGEDGPVPFHLIEPEPYPPDLVAAYLACLAITEWLESDDPDLDENFRSVRGVVDWDAAASQYSHLSDGGTPSAPGSAEDARRVADAIGSLWRERQGSA